MQIASIQLRLLTFVTLAVTFSAVASQTCLAQVHSEPTQVQPPRTTVDGNVGRTQFGRIQACPAFSIPSDAPSPCDRSRLPCRSAHWSWPTARLSNHPSTNARPRDFFDRFYDTRLVPFERKDSGECGPHADLRGCVGESRWTGQVRGVEYRFPGSPNNPGRRFR